MTNEQATDLVRGLLAAYPQGEKISRDTAAIYAADLATYDYEEARAAVSAARRESEYFPTIAAIVSQIVKLRSAHLPDWTGAWEMVLKYEGEQRRWRDDVARAERELDGAEYEKWIAAGQPSLIGKLASPPAEVMRALEMIGGLTEVRITDNIGVLRAHFRDAYKSVLGQHDAAIRREGIGEPRRLELEVGSR